MSTDTKRSIYYKKYYKEHEDEFKSYRKEFYEKNKEALNKMNMDYYYANKDKLGKKIICACNGRYTYKNKSQHIKSKLHQTYLARLDQSDDSSSDSDTD